MTSSTIAPQMTQTSRRWRLGHLCASVFIRGLETPDCSSHGRAQIFTDDARYLCSSAASGVCCRAANGRPLMDADAALSSVDGPPSQEPSSSAASVPVLKCVARVIYGVAGPPAGGAPGFA